MNKKIAVIGMGHFGIHLAIGLAKKGADVLAIDDSLDRLDEVKDQVTHTVRLDATEETPLRSQGLEEFDAVVVAIGDNFEASLLTVAMLQKVGVNRIIVRATTAVHERILEHLGVKEIILPAAEAAERLANSLLFENVLDSYALSSDYTIAEVTVPDGFIGRTVEELDLQKRFEISLVTIKRMGKKSELFGLRKKEVETILGVPQPGTRVERGDILVVFGAKQAIQRLTEAE
ncbi:MAG: TrkA family potassium uptake protein [Bacteroidota bacterium]